MALKLAVNREVTRETYMDAAAIRAAVDFRVDVAHERAAVRVCPVGELDVGTIAQLRARIDEATAAGAGCLILDLRGVTFLDSSGLHLAVETNEWAARTGTEFAIIAGPAGVQRTFDVAGLSNRLPFVDVPRGAQSL
jgi:anti-sigma B factor antagonist